MEHNYKSPIKKLLKVFEKGRDQWKAKTLETKYALKIQKNRVKFLETSKENLKQENKTLKNINKQLEQELSMLRLKSEIEISKKKL